MYYETIENCLEVFDTCPYDENDADEDGICGDVDECPCDGENDADQDGHMLEMLMNVHMMQRMMLMKMIFVEM